VVLKALKIIMEQMGASVPIVDSSDDGTSWGANGATQGTSSSSSSLAGAVDMPAKQSLAAKHPYPAEVKNPSANMLPQIELPSAAEYLARTSISVPTTSSAHTGSSYYSRNIPSSNAAHAPSTETPISHQQPNTTASTLVLDTGSRSSLESPYSSHASLGTIQRTPARVNRTRLAESILKELGIPAGSVPALATKEEKKLERKKEKKRRREAWEAAVLIAVAEETTHGLTQAISEAQSSHQDLTLDTSMNRTSPSLGSRPQMYPAHPAEAAHLLQSESSDALSSARPVPSSVDEAKHADTSVPDKSRTMELPASSPSIPHLPIQTTTPNQSTISQISMQITPLHPSTKTRSSPQTPPATPSPPTEPLFLVGDSDPDSMMEVDHLIDESDSPKQYVDVEDQLPSQKKRDTMKGLRTVSSVKKMSLEPGSPPKDVKGKKLESLTSVMHSLSRVSSSADINSKKTSETDIQSDAGSSRKDTMKRSRFYIEVPPLPKWVKTERIRAQSYEETSEDGSS
jgi:hypothetical protein